MGLGPDSRIKSAGAELWWGPGADPRIKSAGAELSGRCHHVSGSASDGSRSPSSWTLSWVGPRREQACSTTNPSSSGDVLAVRSWHGAKVPKMPAWSVVWLAPVPRSRSGRSALTTTTRRPVWCASMTAGSRLPTAVPDVVTTATGRRDPVVRPSARNPADRSSTRTCRRRSPFRSAAWSARAKGAEREPGASTTSRTPPSHSCCSTRSASSGAVRSPVTVAPVSRSRARRASG